MTIMTILIPIFLTDFLSKVTLLDGSFVHQREDGSIFSGIPFVGLAVIMWDPIEDRVSKQHENVEDNSVITGRDNNGLQ